MTTCPSCGAEISNEESSCKACDLALPGKPFNNTQATDHIEPAQNHTTPDRFGTGELLPQQSIQGRYYIMAKVAQGGMSTVYKARDNCLGGKIVALKEMSEAAIVAQSRQHFLEAFNSEAELMAQFNHPNLVKVISHFQAGPYHYMVMEYVEGRTLAQMIEGTRKPFPEDRVMVWAEQLCDALHYLHSQEPVVIYRDLKPGNIIVNEQTDHVQIIDFGIACFYKYGSLIDTLALGTEGYAPPEQYGSEQLDARVDIYALGVTLYELLTLQDPVQHMLGLGNARAVNPWINPILANAIEKAVQQDRHLRYRTITEMWEAMSGRPARWMNPQSNPPLAGLAPNPGVTGAQFSTVDFGTITAHSHPSQHSQKANIPPGKELSIVAADPWVHAHPVTLGAAGGNLIITIDTQTLRPGKRVRPGGFIRSWINFHAARLVPETREYRSSISCISYIRLENLEADHTQIPLKVMIKPSGWRVLTGWLVVISMMLFEITAFFFLITAGLFWLGW